MSGFDEFDAMGGDDFFSSAIPEAGPQQGFDDEDNDMFSMFEEGARNEGGGYEIGGDRTDLLPTTFGLTSSTELSTQPAAATPAVPTPAAVGAKRPRDGPTSSDARPVSQDFSILHSDAQFKELFTTPESVILATPIVVNCIGLVYLGCGVDLRALACSVRNVEYNCSRAPRAVLRLVEPHCSAIIRSNGVVTIVGSGSVQATKTAAELTARIIRCALGLTDLLAVKFRLRTLMVRFDLQRPIRIGNLAADNPGCASYEPETFCACILRLTGTLLSDGSSFGEPAAAEVPAVQQQQADVVAAPVPIPEGALQEEVDDFFDMGDMGFGTMDSAPMAMAPQVASAAPQTQARALSAVRWTISVNVFVSGKATMIGAKSVDEVAAAYLKLLRLVRPHMRV